MPAQDDEDANIPYLVVVNHEEQHALWRAELDIPAGWRQVFGPAPKAECLTYVEENWTDMRPLSLRKAMAEDQSAAEGS
jgi:MbtH protein